MNDDLGTPAAVAAIHDTVRVGNKQIAENAVEALSTTHAAVQCMLNVLGLNPADPGWGQDHLDKRVENILIDGLLSTRAAAPSVERLDPRRRNP